ncbi:MAG TPA: OFA family MFS transporter [Tissierellia bacterium]|nr:OFA family MFS transporter [Tissierellia bacterium]
MDARLSHPNRIITFIGTFLSIFLLSVNGTFSILTSYLAAERNWDLAVITWAYPLSSLVIALTGMIAGPFADKRDCRTIMFFGGIFCGAGWILTGMANSVLMFFLSYGIIMSIGAGMLYNPLLTSTLRLFPDVRGKASGILLSAAPLGPFVMSPVLNAGYVHMGVSKTLLIFGTAVAIVPALFASSQRRASYDEYDDDENNKYNKEKRDRKNHVRDYTPKEMVKTSLFYKMFFIFLAAAAAGNMMIGVLFTIAREQIKLTASLAAVAVSVSTISNFAGRLAFGAIYDRIGGIRALHLSLGISILALIAISFAGPSSVVLFFIAVVGLGFAFGGPMVVFPPLTELTFGTKYLGVNYGIIFIAYSFAAFVGPRIATYFFTSTGAFTNAYYVSAALAVVGMLFVFNLKKALNNKNNLIK